MIEIEASIGGPALNARNFVRGIQSDVEEAFLAIVLDRCISVGSDAHVTLIDGFHIVPCKARDAKTNHSKTDARERRSRIHCQIVAS